jgi:hypothetical protein
MPAKIANDGVLGGLSLIGIGVAKSIIKLKQSSVECTIHKARGEKIRVSSIRLSRS